MFAEAIQLKSVPRKVDLFPAEDCVIVENLLTTWDGESTSEQQSYLEHGHFFKSTAEVWMPFDFLIGEDCSNQQ